ncbi:MAG: GGDEF domain-containing protein [Burkholderiales bacterium]|nr:GGDEF domain-containing protein [Burkholderiales bacterium]
MKTLRLFDPKREPFSDMLLFDGAAPEDIVDVLGRSCVCRTEPDEVVLGANIPNETVYMVLHGELRVDLLQAGDDDVIHLGRGECVGELSVIDGSLTSNKVQAIGECDLLVLEGPAILTLVDRSHAVARNLLRILSRRLRGTNALLSEEVRTSEIMRLRSITDTLTGLYNRGWFDDTLRRMVARADQGGASFALLVADIDRFKLFNDTWGHQSGDYVLQQVAEALRASLRPTDFAARYGGEEFALLLPTVLVLESAALIAERVRSAVRRIVPLPGHNEKIPPITISIGIAVRQPGEGAEALFRRADELLYRAKREGRDRAVG